MLRTFDNNTEYEYCTCIGIRIAQIYETIKRMCCTFLKLTPEELFALVIIRPNGVRLSSYKSTQNACHMFATDFFKHYK